MFCYIHEGGELKNGAHETIQYISGHTIYIEIDERIPHDEFRSRVCGILNTQPNFVKIEFIVKFDPSSLILLSDDASFCSMLQWNDIYCRVYVSPRGRVDCDIPGSIK